MKRITSYLLLFTIGLWILYCGPANKTGSSGNSGAPTAPADTTPPAVTSEMPLNNSTLVAINTVITVTFSESMDTTSINTGSITLADADAGNTQVTGNVTYDNPTKTATFTPSATLAAGHAFIVTVGTLVKDVAGNAMTASDGINFTTDSSSDTTAPTIVSRSPASGASNIHYNTANINATFSEAVQPGTVMITVNGNSTGVLSGTPAYDSVNKKAIFTPSSSLTFNEIYTVTINATDYANNAMTQDVYTFTIEADTYPPIASSVNPANLSTGVGANSTVSATFNKPMTAVDFTTSTFTLKQGTYNVSGAVSYSGNTATFTATYGLEINKSYTATIASTVTDSLGNALGTSKVWTFSTGSSGDTTAPIILSTSPGSSATSVATSSLININFSESINTATLTPTNFKVQYGVSMTCVTTVAGAIAFNAVSRVATFTPTSALKSNYTYTVTLKGGVTGIKDSAGNALASDLVFTFLTGTVETKTVAINWTALHEKSVNNTGGGYHVYWDITTPVNTVTASLQDVTWLSGNTPATTNLSLNPGNYYVKVQAFGNIGGAITSAPSSEILVCVP